MTNHSQHRSRGVSGKRKVSIALIVIGLVGLIFFSSNPILQLITGLAMLVGAILAFLDQRDHQRRP